MDKEKEKKLLIAIIGLLDALYNDKIPLCEAERAIFIPRIQKELSIMGCNPKIMDIVAEGCELEDILSLLPDRYKDNVLFLKERALILLDEYSETSFCLQEISK